MYRLARTPEYVFTRPSFRSFRSFRSKSKSVFVGILPYFSRAKAPSLFLPVQPPRVFNVPERGCDEIGFIIVGNMKENESVPNLDLLRLGFIEAP